MIYPKILAIFIIKKTNLKYEFDQFNEKSKLLINDAQNMQYR